MKQKSVNYNLMAAILFGLMALFYLPHYLPSLLHPAFRIYYLLFLIRDVLPLAAYAFTAVVLFLGRRDQRTALAFRLLAVSALLSLIGNDIRLTLLLSVAAGLGLTLQSEVVFTGRFAQFYKRMKKLWFLPGAVCAVEFLATLWNLMAMARMVRYAGLGFFWTNLSLISMQLSRLFHTPALLLASLWILWPEGLPRVDMSNISVSAGDGYCGIIKFLLLSIFTLGIWFMVWVYRTTRYLNRVEGELPQRPGTQVVACLFVPFYTIYWMYKNAQRLDRLSAAYGLTDNLAVLCLALTAMPFGLLAGALIQDRINTIALINSGDITLPAPPRAAASVGSTPISVEANPDQLPEL